MIDFDDDFQIPLRGLDEENVALTTASKAESSGVFPLWLSRAYDLRTFPA